MTSRRTFCAVSNYWLIVKVTELATTELDELSEDSSDLADGFSKYAEELEALTGFSILEEGTTDTYKDLYDIFAGISETWSGLSDTVRSRVSEILGGTRQLQIISSIMSNWTDAENAYADAISATNVALSSNEEYMDTIEAKTAQFSSTLQELASDALDTDFIKNIVDLGTDLIEVLDAIIENVGMLGVSIAGIGIAAFAKSFV